MKNHLTIKSSAICCTDPTITAEFGLPSVEPDKTLLPAALRRRASLTTRLAITAAQHACAIAEADAKHLVSIFASVGGEIQVTDELCRTLPDTNALLSPTQFHNSVHNATAGYWTILQSCQAANTAIAALDDTFAIGLLEAAAQLQQTPGDILLVCYDEHWPQYLAPPMGGIPLACALVLSNKDLPHAGFALSPPQFGTCTEALGSTLCDLIRTAPAAAAFPLLTALREARSDADVALNLGDPCWFTHLTAL
ncbi:MAG: beta-ketoacyl synthase chain length factor [Gammaproteobacteria bacterium]